MTRISFIIIALNEEEMIEDCLKSASWADEIILLDGGSTDKTLKIAQKYQAKIFSQEVKEKDWAAWHNQGKKLAKNEWIFYLDADERVTPALKEEIKSSINHQSSVIAFAIPRRNILLGKEMQFGGWYPDYQIRLFKKNKLLRWEGQVHERPIFEGELGYFKNPLLHLTHRNLSTMVEKSRDWSKIEARLLFEAHHPPVTWWRILKMMSAEFWQRFVKKQAWRDGMVGWIEGLFQVFNKFLIYGQLWEIQKQK